WKQSPTAALGRYCLARCRTHVVSLVLTTNSRASDPASSGRASINLILGVQCLIVPLTPRCFHPHHLPLRPLHLSCL
ncbi:hypothetical protein GW17_00026246, partial [Ensete ventricosum]